MRKIGFLVAALVAAGVYAAPAAAKPKKPNAEAQRFERMAKKAYVKKEWDDAAAAFELAFGADPLPKYLFNIGRCYEKKGDLPGAAEYLRRYLATTSGNEEERKDVEALIALVQAKLEKKRSEVRIRTEPSHAVVRIAHGEEKVEGFAPYTGWLTFGAWALEVTLDGHQPVKQTLAVRKGKPVDLQLKLERIPEPKPEPPPPPEPKPDPKPDPKPEPPVAKDEPDPPPKEPEPSVAETPPEEGGSLLPWVVLGASGAALAGAGVFGWLSLQAEQRRDDLKSDPVRYDDVKTEDDAARGHALVSNVLVGVGAAGAVAGVALLLLSDADEEASAGLLVVPLPGGAGLVLEGRR